MTDIADLEALARRCEEATGAGAEERQCVIDAYNLIFPHEIMLSEEEKGDDDTRYRRTMHRVEFTNYINTDYHRASLDAAMSLVPEGWLLQFSEWEHAVLRARGPWQAILVRQGQRDSLTGAFDARCEHASSPALALTAASLRARAHLTGERK